ncbi:MAG TPA: FAD-binding oxidoreductase [Devosia sp.]|jgi:glycine/D-amino acid oxidase-like deaminating enzyme|uniref:NAD(P)/FAD-dependent oxidoreductase n=1 Tax=Devosia sp. TaxID=1871048 RepID=UPI002DDC9497|nr:FAD-binding oxidoreductase [Devosia sp.]HEV2515399.1 FAD-binding oxidoreductase [Devosia sp.]
MPQSARITSRIHGIIAIVGAGIVGMSAAYFLSRAGWRVIVLDAGSPASGATGASDGAVSVASKKPGPLMTLAVAAVQFYEQLMEAGVLVDEFASRSTFVVASDEEELAVLERHAAGLQAAGVPISYLRGGALAEAVGVAAPAALAAVEVRGEGHAIGYRVVERLRQLGGFEIRRDVRVVSLRHTGGRVDGVVTDRGIVPVDAVLLAAGLGSAAFLEAPGLIRSRKGQLIVTDRAGEDMPRFPGPLMSCRYLVSKGSQANGSLVEGRSLGLVIDPLATGQFLIGGSREDSDDKYGTDSDIVACLLADAVALSPSLAQLRVIRVFAGLRAATPDGFPIVGQLEGVDNVWIATGFEGDGICLGPLMGRICQQLICGQHPQQDISALDARRFKLMLAAA